MVDYSTISYSQFRKLDFPIIKHSGGVPDALRQHRESVAHLLGPDEPPYWYAGTSLDLPESPGLPSIFDFGDPLEEDEEDGEIVQTIEVPVATPSPSPAYAPVAAPASSVQDGTDKATLRMVEDVAAGKRRSSRNPHLPPARPRTPSQALEEAPVSPTPSPAPPAKKRKRTRCHDDDDDFLQLGDDVPSPSLPPRPKKQRKAQSSLVDLDSSPSDMAASSLPTSTSSPPSRTATPRGNMIGRPLPKTVQDEIYFISAMPKLKSGYPSRNLMRKADETANEISRKSGYLMTTGRGGSLRRWFGDEDIFTMEMWRWLVGEHM